MARKDKNKGAADPVDRGSKGVSPVDIQQKEFRESFRGYNEREVDQFLDQVTEEMARLHSENKRLQEQVEFRQTLPLDSASAEAEEIMRRAKAEADRILERARAVGSGFGAGQPAAGGVDSIEMVNRYLAREREFLQSLASKIQQHIEAVREDVRTIRDAERTGGGSAPVDLTTLMQSAPEDSTPEDAALEASAGESGEEEESTEDRADAPVGGEQSWADANLTSEASTDDGDDEEGPGDGAGTRRWVIPQSEETGSPPESRFEDGQTHPSPTSWPGAEAPQEGRPEAGAGGGSAWAERGPADLMERPEREGTGAPPGLPGHLEASTGASVGASAPEEDAGQERSLRELFWGED